MRLTCRKLALIALVLVLAGSPLAAAPPPEIKKLHVVLVFDTGDDFLAPSLEKDEKRICKLLRETIPQDRMSLRVLKDKQVTPETILGHYRSAKPDANDGLLFFYGGHGATDTVKKQHFFQLACGKDLPRAVVRKAMKEKKTALVLMLTDCCSTPEKMTAGLEPRDVRAPRPRPKELHPTVRCLFFQARGTIDVTAATNAPSWSDTMEGGLFTRTLCKMMTKPVKSLGGNGDGLVGWREFFPRLQKETEAVFKSWSKNLKARGEKGIDSLTQKPAAFALGQDVVAGQTFAVVGIENGTKFEIAYRYRWTGEEEWKDAVLAIGERKPHFVTLKDGQQTLPRLEVEIKGRKAPLPALKSGRWSGERTPSFDDGRVYRLGPQKKES